MRMGKFHWYVWHGSCIPRSKHVQLSVFPPFLFNDKSFLIVFENGFCIKNNNRTREYGLIITVCVRTPFSTRKWILKSACTSNRKSPRAFFFASRVERIRKLFTNNVQIVIVSQHASIAPFFTVCNWTWHILRIFIAHIKSYDFQWINKTAGEEKQTSFERIQIEFIPFAMNHRSVNVCVCAYARMLPLNVGIAAGIPLNVDLFVLVFYFVTLIRTTFSFFHSLPARPCVCVSLSFCVALRWVFDKWDYLEICNVEQRHTIQIR